MTWGMELTNWKDSGAAWGAAFGVVGGGLYCHRQIDPSFMPDASRENWRVCSVVPLLLGVATLHIGDQATE